MAATAGALRVSSALARGRLEAQERRSAVPPLLVACFAVAVAFLAGGGPLWLVTAAVVAAVIAVRPVIGLYFATATLGLDTNLNSPFEPFGIVFKTIPGLTVTPLELLVIWTLVCALAQAMRQGSPPFPQTRLLATLVLFLVLLLLAVEQGTSRGGDFIIALWEIRAILLVLPMMLTASVLIREREDLKTLAKLLLVVLGVMTFEMGWRYIQYVRPGQFSGGLEIAYGHETSVLVGLLVVFAAAWTLWGPHRKQRLIALATAVVSFVILMTMRRRAGLIAAETGLLVIAVYFLLKVPKRFLMYAPLALLVTVVYFAAFWNNPNSLGQPVRSFRTVFDSGSLNNRDRTSDEYRRVETLNVWWNIQAHPVDGIGFGVPYAKPAPFPDLTSFWPFWPYVPHNTVLWLWMKAGVLPFIVFWCLLGFGIQQAAAAAKRTNDPLVLVAAIGISAYIVMAVLFSYVDLGLMNPRVMTMLGLSLGLLTVVDRLSRREQEPVSLPLEVVHEEDVSADLHARSGRHDRPRRGQRPGQRPRGLRARSR